MWLIRLAPAAFAILALPVSFASTVDSGERGDFSKIPDGLPIYCALIGSDRQVCTWHEGRTHHTVCELDFAGKLAGEPCFQQNDNDSMTIFSTSSKKYRNARRGLQEMRKGCRAILPALKRAMTVRQVSELVGVGPQSCRLAGDDLTCRWNGVRRTPGYPTLAKLAMNNEGDRLDLICEFNEGGQSRGYGSCRIGSADAPADLYKALNCQ
jgi:hypothetical protein